MAVNRDRLVSRLEALGQVGATPAGGVTRLPYTPEYREAERMTRGWMKEAGLDVRADAVGNLIGRREGRKREQPCLILASHIDSVVNGGRFDGTLGVLSAIEVAHALSEDGAVLDRALEVVVFIDEEGTRWSDGLFGSKAMAGQLPDDALERLDGQQISRAEAMENWGLDPTRSAEAARDTSEIGAYLELHIEQGAVLESQGLTIGVVNAIAGPVFLAVSLCGRADHAGATPMGKLRRDALVGAAEAILAAEAVAKSTSSSGVMTVGRVEVTPGAINVIPGDVTLTLDIRDIDEEMRDRAEASIRREIEQICQRRRLTFRVDQLQRVKPVTTSPVVVEAISAACAGMGLPAFHLPSGAAHDAQVLAGMADVGMIFVRCRAGISHSPQEYVTPDDAFLGAQVMYQTALRLGRQ